MTPTRLAILAAAVLASGPARAAWPERPITMIVPFAAGGPTDVTARIVGEHMSHTLGQQIVVENVTGAGGTTGIVRASQAAPDGYGIMMGHMGTHGAAPAVYPNLKYDPTKDFAPVGMAAGTPILIVARKDFPSKDTQGVRGLPPGRRRQAQRGPRRGGLGEPHHLLAALLHRGGGGDPGGLPRHSVKDLGALLDWIGEQPGMDASRVLVMGGSYGGYMALATSVRYAERIAGAVSTVGISSFVTFLERTETYRRDLRRVEYGDERDPALREFMERTAPANNASRITKPLLVIQGANDPRVPRSEADQIVAAVRKNGGAAWYLLDRDEGHGAGKKANADFQFHVMAEFVRRHLVGAGTP